jgi:hypothetical protein
VDLGSFWPSHLRDGPPKISHHGVSDRGMGKDPAMENDQEVKDVGPGGSRIAPRKVLAVRIH